MKTKIKNSILIISFLLAAFSITHTSTAQDLAKVQSAFSKSYTAEYKKEYPKAYEAIKAIYDEKSYEINLRLAWVAYLNGSNNESIIYYQKAIALNPFSIEARLGIVYPANELKNKELLKTSYEEILKIDPKNSIANYRLGCIYYYKADYINASKYLETASSLYPFDYSINYTYAWTMYKMGKLTEAKILFNKLLMISPYDTYAMEGLALIK